MNVSEISEILPNLYIGNEKWSDNNELTFDLVINCTTNLPLPSNTKSIRIPIQDDPLESNRLFQILRDTNILQEIHDARKANKNVLVHCQAGQQRSPAVVACYLIVFHGMDTQQSIDYIKQKRPIAFFWKANLLEALQSTCALSKREA